MVVTCSDPLIADVIEGIDATFIRLPGVQLQTRWHRFQSIMAQNPKVVAFLCHNQCRAHGGQLEEAQRAVQWARHAFWHTFGKGTAFLSGKVDIETRYISFFQDNGNLWSVDDLKRSTPESSMEPLTRLLDVNKDRSPLPARSTSPLHPPVTALVVVVDGTFNDVRERNLAYVLDHVGQDAVVFAEQVSTLGQVVLDNAAITEEIPHLLVVGNHDREANAGEIFECTASALHRLSDGVTFTAQIVLRHPGGRFELVSTHKEISADVW